MEFETTKAAWTVFPLMLEREGYQPTPLIIQRNEWDAGKVVGSWVLCLPALFWSADLLPEYDVDLVPIAGQPAAPGTPSPTPPPERDFFPTP